MTDMTNARAAVYATREPLVRACPELTVDRVILDYTVSPATRQHEAAADKRDCYRVSWQSWRSVCRQRIKNLAFLRNTHWLAVY